MREMIKSMVSLAWAMSLLGLKQAIDRIGPARLRWQLLLPEGLNSVTDAAVAQLGDPLQNIFHRGNAAQKRGIDLVFGEGQRLNWRLRRAGAGSPGDDYEIGRRSRPRGAWGPMPHVRR